jgi:nucleotide-binding universal stress UspA family protein
MGDAHGVAPEGGVMGIIVVGVDLSETARRAAEVAADLAVRTGSRVHVVRAVERGAVGEVTAGGEVFHVDWLDVASSELGDLVRDLEAPGATSAVVVGSAADVICREAERVGAEFVVVGNRRVRGIGRVLGSIANDVLRNAPCHVLVADTVV